MGRVWEFEEKTHQYTQTSLKSVREDETKVSHYTQLLAIIIDVMNGVHGFLESDIYRTKCILMTT